MLALKELLHNLKDRDWDINPTYKIDENEARRIIEGIEAVENDGKWIPCKLRLPEDREWINPLPFICDYVGRETKATTKEFWILRGLTDIDEPCDYYLNLECVAWMPLPQPYKIESEG